MIVSKHLSPKKSNPITSEFKKSLREPFRNEIRDPNAIREQVFDTMHVEADGGLLVRKGEQEYFTSSIIVNEDNSVTIANLGLATPLSVSNGGTGTNGSSFYSGGILYVNLTNDAFTTDTDFYYTASGLTNNKQTFLNARTEIAADNATYALTVTQSNSGGNGAQFYTAAVQDDNVLALNVIDGSLNTIMAVASSGHTQIINSLTEDTSPALMLSKDNAGLDADNIISKERAILHMHNPNNSAQGFMAFSYGDSQTIIGGMRFDVAGNLNWHAGTVSSVGRHLFWTAAGTAISGGAHKERLGIEDNGLIINPPSAGDSPTAWVDISGQSSDQPGLRVRSGSLASSTVDGAVEFDGFNFWMTT